MSATPHEPLEVALAAERPIDDAPRQPLAVELLLTESQRVSVDQHLAFQQSIAGPSRKRSEAEVSRVLNLLDEIDGKERAQ